MVTKSNDDTQAQQGEKPGTAGSNPEDAASISEETALEPIDGFTDDALKDLETWDQVLEITGKPTHAADVLGNGYAVCDDKMVLVNKPFLILKYGVHPSETTGGEFTTIHVLTRDGQKWVVNDGGTGIHEQLKTLKEDRGVVCPLEVSRGLRVSEYDYENPQTKKKTRARTFYLNTAK